uniref:Vps72/YL1 N-terminal domain-containing protein n=1 Tax=Peronospora matthiolae TaxID=2874970 RepID=A0AAV1ULH9_9STRA
MMSRPRNDLATRKVLPARSSRGTRIHKLIGEEAEIDASFWGHSAWHEDGEDEDYSTEAEEEDVVDSDFDQEEHPDIDVHDDEDNADDKVTKRKRSGTNSGRYKEPLSNPALKRKVSENRSTLPAAPTSSMTSLYQYVAPTVRSSTVKKSSESSEMRRQASHQAAKLAAKHKKGTVEKVGSRLTQAQLLAEAVRTEVENTQSLQRLEQLEEEKKVESLVPKAPSVGRMVRYYSKLDTPKTITFLNALDFPPIFNQLKPKKPISAQQQKMDRRRREAEEKVEHENACVDKETFEEKDARQHGLLQSSTPRSGAKAAVA